MASPVSLPEFLKIGPSGRIAYRASIEAEKDIVVWGHPRLRAAEYRLCSLRPGDRALFEALPLDEGSPLGPVRWRLVEKVALTS